VQCGLFFNRTASSSDAAGFSFSPTTSHNLRRDLSGIHLEQHLGQLSLGFDALSADWPMVVCGSGGPNKSGDHLSVYLDQNNNNQPVFLTAATAIRKPPKRSLTEQLGSVAILWQWGQPAYSPVTSPMWPCLIRLSLPTRFWHCSPRASACRDIRQRSSAAAIRLSPIQLNETDDCQCHRHRAPFVSVDVERHRCQSLA